ncbi:sigma-70 family RNA polymerase sigma factor [Neobacillus sp. D3-1R]|uniref:sigma-70 family RNA polymerase sigma factor n=1 Tax=Neobacillus sp. D3-1R TaxID=3445778 RepID=UPI003F9EFEF3
MIPAKIEPVSITPITEKDLESIVDWFGQHKQSFYILGLTYFQNQKQLEELFYRTILKVNKEYPRFNGESTFDTWVTSIFIQTCRDLSIKSSLQASVESEQRPDLFKVLDPLKKEEKEAIALKYLKGLPLEDVAYLLRIPVGKIREQLFIGIQSLKKELGYEHSSNGCKEYHKNYIEYLEGTLDRSDKVDFEIHLYHCQNCQVDLAEFQKVMVYLADGVGDFYVPYDLIENVKTRLVEREKNRSLKNKKRFRIGVIFASIFVVLMGIEVFTKSFSNLYYTYTEEDQQLREFLQRDMAEVLNLKAENNGVKMTIKSVIADDVQTLVFYEIEDTAEDNQYIVDVNEGIFLENQSEFKSHVSLPRQYPPDLESDANKEKKNVFQGKVSLLPMREDKGTIKLKITKLQKLKPNVSVQMAYENRQLDTGEWNFEIPVKKHPATEYALDKQTKVEGIPVRFDKLIFAPTATILQYSMMAEAEKRIEVLNFNTLEVDNKKVKADMYGSNFTHGGTDWATYQVNFDPLFVEKPKEVNIQLDSAFLMVTDRKTIDLDASQQYPQTFEYAGSSISIDKFEVGQPTRLVISNHVIKNRAYESLQFAIFDENGSTGSMEMDIDGVLADKNGNEYNTKKATNNEKIEEPRYFITAQKISLNSNNGEEMIPKRLEIFGYNTKKYLDDVVKISLE